MSDAVVNYWRGSGTTGKVLDVPERVDLMSLHLPAVPWGAADLPPVVKVRIMIFSKGGSCREARMKCMLMAGTSEHRIDQGTGVLAGAECDIEVHVT